MNFEKIKILKSIEHEFNLEGLSSLYIDIGLDLSLDFFVIDCYILGRDVSCSSPLKFVELIYFEKGKHLKLTVSERNTNLINFLKKNRHMLHFWML